MNFHLGSVDWAALSPMLILLVGALVILLVESFAEKIARLCSSWLCGGFILAALFAAIYAPNTENPLLTPWLRFDPLARSFTIFFLLIGLASTLLSAAFFRRYLATHGEYYFLFLSALLGLILIGDAADFLTLFLGIETLSIALYILCGYIKRWEMSQEASIKYFLMGALGSALLLYGIALIYGAVGTTQFDLLLKGYRSLANGSEKTLFLSGIALVTFGLAFKAAIVPFHAWAPDVYDGAPNPVTAFMAVGTKVGAFAGFVRVFMVALPHFDPVWNQGIALLAFPTLIYANLVAMRQVQLRRFFAYSGISHAGFLLIPLAVGTPEALSALLFYLSVYVTATLGAFAILAFLDQKSEGVLMQDLRGLFQQAPLAASILAFCLLTLAGIPPTVGFFAKFYLFKVAFQAGYYALVVVGLLTTIFSAYYYLRIIAVMLSSTTEESFPPYQTWPATLVGVVSFVLLVCLSFYPAAFMNLFA